MMKENERFDDSMGRRGKGIENFNEKLKDFIDLIGNRRGMTSNKRRYLMKEAEGTTDFPILFGTVLERTLRAKYALVNQDWRKITKVGTQNDFRNSWDMALYGNRQTLPVVKERGEYKDGQLGDGKFVIALQKFGRKFSLSWEAVINDDLGAFSDIAQDLSLAAGNSEAKYATQLYSGSAGPNTTLFQTAAAHPIDGQQFTNLGSLPLTGDNIAKTVTLMKSQKDYDGNPILFNRFILVTPVNKEYAALQALSTNLLIATALGSTSAAATQTSENVIAKYPITVVTNPWLDILGGSTATTAWYLFGDPSDGDAIKLNFLRGHENPEIVQKMTDKISLGGAPISPLEGDFDSDSVIWRVRHVFGGVQTDPRYAFAQNSTT